MTGGAGRDAAAERVWYGRGLVPALARGALAPAEALFRAAVLARGALYDARVLPQHALGAPAVSVGNLSVGGTGKTPVAAWVAARLRARGARPAIVLRGYGDDEPAVHALLNPDVPVIADPDRVAGAAGAIARGANVLVLDDAFQHRRARRDVDLVLVSAERGSVRARMLPAGPLREPLRALRRASAVIVTRRIVSREAAEVTAAEVAPFAGDVPVSCVSLPLDGLRRWDDKALARPEREARDGTVESASLTALAGRRALAIAAVGDPGAFFGQLEQRGISVDPAPFRDHHRYTATDVRQLAARATHADVVVCTLKDAVKLGPLWPHAARPLWYVTQRVAVERGSEALDSLLGSLLESAAAGTHFPDTSD